MLQEVETPPRARRDPRHGTFTYSSVCVMCVQWKALGGFFGSCVQCSSCSLRPTLTRPCTVVPGGSLSTGSRGDAAAAHTDDDQTPVRGPTTLKNQEKVCSLHVDNCLFRCDCLRFQLPLLCVCVCVCGIGMVQTSVGVLSVIVFFFRVCLVYHLVWEHTSIAHVGSRVPPSQRRRN